MTQVIDDNYFVAPGQTLQDGPTNAQPLQVTITPSSIFDAAINCPITTVPATANVVGGTPPYSYSWTKLSGLVPVNINSPTNQSTTFSRTQSGFSSGTVQCEVTDADSAVVTDSISVSLECGT